MERGGESGGAAAQNQDVFWHGFGVGIIAGIGAA
jgi:hypothetical protein